MAIRKPLIGMLAVVTVAIAVTGLIYVQKERHDPCTQLPRNELAERYPPLAELLEQQRVETTQLLARQRAEDFRMNVEMNSAQFSPEEALKASTQQIDEVAGMRERHKQAFEAMCHKLVDAD
jgi:hypothetical protein